MCKLRVKRSTDQDGNALVKALPGCGRHENLADRQEAAGLSEAVAAAGITFKNAA
jgi:hypothetical protein